MNHVGPAASDGTTTAATVALRADLTPVVTDQGVLLVGEAVEHVLIGEPFRAVVPLLLAPRTEGDLLAETAGTLSPPLIFYVLNELRHLGFIATDRPADPTEAFWHIALGDAAGPAGPARWSPEIVWADPDRADPTVAEALASALAEADLPLPAGGPPPRLVLVDDLRAPALEAVNAAALADGRGFVPVKLLGRRLQLGPWIVPGETACWQCLVHRLRLNAQIETFLDETGQPPLVDRVAPRRPSVVALAARQAALRLAEAARAPDRLKRALYTYDWLDHDGRWHPVTRRPQCSACGDADLLRRPAPFEPGPSPKVADSQRAATPADTAARFAALVSPLTGVVSWLKATDGPDGAGHGLSYTTGAGHNFRIGRGDFDWLKRSLETRTGGKGGTRAAAEASALGEAVERYSSVWRGEEAVRRARFVDLADAAPDPAGYLTWSAAQYADRAAWNAAQGGSRFHVVPNPFDPEAKIDWSPAWSLTRSETRWLPSSYCYFGHPESETHFFSAGESNGCAAGTTRAEAFVHGFAELVERDAVAIWWYNRLRRPGVDIASFGLKDWRRLEGYYAALGRSIWALDLTHDLGIPAFAALSARTDGDRPEVIYGFAAGLDPRAALSAAIGELNQFLPAVSRRDAEGNTLYGWPEPEAIAWWQGERLADHPYLLPADAPPTRLADRPSLATDDHADDVAVCVDRAAAVGLEVLALDLTRPDIGFPVVRVIAPGLRHFWRRLGPGRLYDVPMALGWQPAPTPEADLNPWSIFL
ncbi:MAG: TOMM precursor leader peptide-binding protein [Alphaproteobacteria bacterium]|jgi:ribosomal protein S12 methylthiotransferase accessory factor|nr:TOMM precursor leader peptide-binding protein [Alphaproteobacteria bacterium]